jgi:aminopeptidase N
MATPTEAGGIEYPGLFVIARHLYDREGGFFELATVHETAHQWWYSLVGNDQIDEPWLDEALTQYVTMLYFEHYYGEGVARSILQDSFEGWYKSLNPEDQKMAIGLPAAAYSESIYGAIVYGKGPLFFHEIRKQVGDDVFYRILQTYLKRYRYGIAYPQDWMAVAEELSGQDLGGLYQEWVVGGK